MARRSSALRIVLLLATATFLCLALASAGHWHARTTADAVKADCQLCALGHARSDVSRVAPALFALALIAWCVRLSPAAAPQRDHPALPPPRAPPAC